MTSLTIPQSLFLLLTAPKGGVVGFGTNRRLAVCAGAVVGLALRGVLTLGEGRVHVVGPDTGDAALDLSLDAMRAKQGKKLERVIEHDGANIERAVGQQLAAVGLVGHEPGMLGVGHRYPERDTSPEAALRAHLLDVVTGREQAAAEDAAILGVTKGLGSIKYVIALDEAGMTKKALHARIDEIVDQVAAADGVSQAVAAAVRATNAAVTAAVAAAAGAAATF